MTNTIENINMVCIHIKLVICVVSRSTIRNRIQGQPHCSYMRSSAFIFQYFVILAMSRLKKEFALFIKVLYSCLLIH